MALHNDVSRISCVVMLLSWGVFSILPTLTLHRRYPFTGERSFGTGHSSLCIKIGIKKIAVFESKIINAPCPSAPMKACF